MTSEVRCEYMIERGKNKGKLCNKVCKTNRDIKRCYTHSRKLKYQKERYQQNKNEYRKGGKYYSSCKKIPTQPKESNSN